jgi:hypothetical protein
VIEPAGVVADQSGSSGNLVIVGGAVAGVLVLLVAAFLLKDTIIDALDPFEAPERAAGEEAADLDDRESDDDAQVALDADPADTQDGTDGPDAPVDTAVDLDAEVDAVTPLPDEPKNPDASDGSLQAGDGAFDLDALEAEMAEVAPVEEAPVTDPSAPPSPQPEAAPAPAGLSPDAGTADVVSGSGIGSIDDLRSYVASAPTAEGMYDTAEALIQEGKPTMALFLLRRSGDGGHIPSLMRSGEIFDPVKPAVAGAEKAPDRAYLAYQAAVDLNHAPANYALGALGIWANAPAQAQNPDAEKVRNLMQLEQ